MYIRSAALLSLSLFAAACGPTLTTDPSVTTTSKGDQQPAPPGKSAARASKALVRAVNANPADTDIVWGHEELFNKVAFKTVTPYAEVPIGRAMFALRGADTGEKLSGGHQDLLPGRHYTVLALPAKAGKTLLTVMSDNLGGLESGESRVRLINATKDVKELDLYTGASDEDRLLHGVRAGSSAAMSFVDMTVGPAQIRISGHPTMLEKIDIEPDRMYTLIVVGQASALDVIKIVDRVGD
ncbi:MAG: DUF4397 domain-containing protein [Acidobacteriota bacterium]